MKKYIFSILFVMWLLAPFTFAQIVLPDMAFGRDCPWEDVGTADSYTVTLNITIHGDFIDPILKVDGDAVVLTQLSDYLYIAEWVYSFDFTGQGSGTVDKNWVCQLFDGYTYIDYADVTFHYTISYMSAHVGEHYDYQADIDMGEDPTSYIVRYTAENTSDSPLTASVVVHGTTVGEVEHSTSGVITPDDVGSTVHQWIYQSYDDYDSAKVKLSQNGYSVESGYLSFVTEAVTENEISETHHLVWDNDIDDDGLDNDDDPFPDDPNGDLDSDGKPDSADGDRDGDGVPNDDDLFPNDPDRGGGGDSEGLVDLYTWYINIENNSSDMGTVIASLIYSDGDELFLDNSVFPLGNYLCSSSSVEHPQGENGFPDCILLTIDHLLNLEVKRYDFYKVSSTSTGGDSYVCRINVSIGSAGEIDIGTEAPEVPDGNTDPVVDQAYDGYRAAFEVALDNRELSGDSVSDAMSEALREAGLNSDNLSDAIGDSIASSLSGFTNNSSSSSSSSFDYGQFTNSLEAVLENQGLSSVDSEYDPDFMGEGVEYSKDGLLSEVFEMTNSLSQVKGQSEILGDIITENFTPDFTPPVGSDPTVEFQFLGRTYNFVCPLDFSAVYDWIRFFLFVFFCIGEIVIIREAIA